MQYVGIDVSKAKLDCLWLRDPDNLKVKTKVHENTKKGHEKLIAWLEKNVSDDPGDVSITIEATGIYHETLAHTLFDAGFKVAVINPARSKDFAKGLGSTHKTDKKDSCILALFGCRMKPDLWQPEPPEARELKALLARLDALEGDCQRERNRLEKSEFSASSEVVLESLHNMIHELEEEKKRLVKQIDDHIDKHPRLKKDRQLLETIPGVAAVTSRIMLSVIHSRSFTKASQLAAYLGLIPVKNESGVFKGRSRLSKTGPAKIRNKLYMAAVASLKWNKDIIAQQNRLLKNGKTKMEALGAAMRKLVQICFGVVKNQTEYCAQAA